MKVVWKWGMMLALCGGFAPFAQASTEEITYSKDVAPIINQYCVSCHRPEQVGPMSLMSHKEIRPWAKSIRRKVSEKTMPPWHATKYKIGFSNDRSLSQEQIDTIITWIDSGMKKGDPADLPPMPEFSDGKWQLGEPDMIVTLPEITIPGDSPDVFEDLLVKLNLKEDRWLTAIEVLPGNTNVVHHVIVYQTRGFTVDPMGGWLGAWAAGMQPMAFPEGTGRLLRKGHGIIGDMHYHPTEFKEVDQTKFGLYFADSPDDIKKELVNVWIMNAGFRIPAGAKNHEVRSQKLFRQSGSILSFSPHMHYRGKDFNYTAKYPDGTEELLLQVENYDFGWQTIYKLKEPIHIPAGTIVECVAHFDNSTDNKDNPDPTIDITFGTDSYDEMMIGFLDFIVDDGVRPESTEALKARITKETETAHPNDTYSVYFRSPKDPTVLYLPRDGQNGFVLIGIGRDLTESSIENIKWDGDTFSGIVKLAIGASTTIDGTVDPDTGRINATVPISFSDNNFTIRLKGALSSKFDAEKEMAQFKERRRSRSRQENSD